MERFFNTAGPIDPADHYALDPLGRWDLSEVLGHIDRKKYFLVHAPRQTGKTTCIKALAAYLNQQGKFRCVYVSVEQGQAARQDLAQGIRCVLDELGMAASLQLQDDFVSEQWQSTFARSGATNSLRGVLTRWCQQNPKPLVLLVDEIDALVGNTLIAVLRQLRAGYCVRDLAPFPQSVVLCGMRHLRDYRMELGEEGKEVLSEASPFNINSESLRLGDFSQDDVKTLYAQHTQETGQQFEDGVCERVFELTQGQPWLVNALAYDACFREQAGRDRAKAITVGDIETAKEKLIQRRETHLDQLMAKLKQERVHRVLESMMGRYDLHPTEEDFDYVTDLGLIRRDKTNSSVIANPIYREIIPRVLTASWERDLSGKIPALARPGQPLDMNELLGAFQRFFREHSESWLDQFQYKEAGPQLLLQAFLQRTVNSRGSIQREQAVGSGRTDLVVKWPISSCHPDERSEEGSPHQFDTRGDSSPVPHSRSGQTQNDKKEQKQIIVLELKLIHRNDGANTVITKGLEQTARYMDTCGATEGHLVIFDRRAGKSWDERIWIKHEAAPDGKRIAVWGL